MDPVLIADVVPLESGKAIALGLPVYDALVVFVPGQEIAVERVLGALDHSGGNGRTGGKVHVRHPHGNGVKSFLGGGGLVAPHLVADAVHGNGVHAAAINDGREIVLQSRLPPFLKSLLDGTQSFPVNAVFYCVFLHYTDI